MEQKRQLVYLGSSQKDAKKLPAEVQELFAYALDIALQGGQHEDAKPLTGFNGRSVVDDFGFSNPEEAKTKADLAMLITKIIKEKDLTQQQAADLMNIDQPKVSKIVRGLLSEFSIERLLKFILALGFDIEITPKPHKTR